MSDSFCVFIISHGRPEKVLTYKTLIKRKYQGPLFIVCDNEDKTVDQYRKNFGSDKILVFNKIQYADQVDNCDNFKNRRTTTHARNACFDFAKSLGFEYFLVLDDDYTDFRFTFDKRGVSIRKQVRLITPVFHAMIKMLNVDERIDSVCMMQTGDMVGWQDSTTMEDIHFPFKRRKAMNSFFCKTSRRFWFFSRLNEDVNTYMSLGSRGRLFFTIPDVYLQQAQTQATSGGMSEAYLASGTYVKSFYTVMIGPSYAITTITASMKRLHHKINWNNASPKILDDSHKKI